MGKSKPKSYGNKGGWQDEDEDYFDVRSAKQRRREKKLRNLIRSKNVDRLVDLDDDEYEYGNYR